jgi:hypothetical protein
MQLSIRSTYAEKKCRREVEVGLAGTAGALFMNHAVHVSWTAPFFEQLDASRAGKGRSNQACLGASRDGSIGFVIAARWGRSRAVRAYRNGWLEVRLAAEGWCRDGCFDFQESVASVETPLLPGKRRISMVALPALALLKLVAWEYRHRVPGKDVPDLSGLRAIPIDTSLFRQ